MKRFLNLSMFFLIIALSSAAYVSAQTTGASKTTTTTAKDKTEPAKKDSPEIKKDGEKTPESKSVSFRGQVMGNYKMFLEAGDMINFNVMYYSRAVYTYAYFVSRPALLKLVFKDYKDKVIILNLTNTDLFNLPNLYSEKLYEIRGRVGHVKGDKLHMQCLSLKPMFVEKDHLDR